MLSAAAQNWGSALMLVHPQAAAAIPAARADAEFVEVTPKRNRRRQGIVSCCHPGERARVQLQIAGCEQFRWARVWVPPAVFYDFGGIIIFFYIFFYYNLSPRTLETFFQVEQSCWRQRESCETPHLLNVLTTLGAFHEQALKYFVRWRCADCPPLFVSHFSRNLVFGRSHGAFFLATPNTDPR